MALERTVNGDLYPNPEEDRKERDDNPRRAANIQKFKELVIKLAGSAPNKPFSETQKNSVGECLNELLSDLRKPDHPPYSVMIERAINELNKDGCGSSEESISNFIRKEYDDLPWSHFTLLKHHLGALCDCGTIIRTNRQRYLLAGTDAIGKNCTRRKSRKEQDSEREKRDIGRECVLQKQQCLEAQARKEDAKQIDDLERPPGFETVAFEETSNLPVSCTEIRNHELLEAKSVAAKRSKQGSTKIRIKIPSVKPSSFKRRKSRKEQDSEREKRDIGRECVLQKQQRLEAQARKEDAKQIDDLESPPGFETVAFEETSNLPVSCTEITNHELLEVKSVAATRSKQGSTKIRIKIPSVKPSSFEEPHPPQEIIDSSSCSAASSFLHLQSQEQAISDSDTSKQQKVKSLTNNGSEHKVHSVQEALPSCTEERHPSVCSKLDKQYQAHKSPELGASNIEESSPTLRTQHKHKNRWYKPDQLHQAPPVKSSQLTMKQAIIDMQVKKNERQQKVSSLRSSSDQQEFFKKFSSLQMHPKHPLEKRVSQKLSSRLSRPWLLISPPSHSHHEQQQQQNGKPESGIITNDNPNHHPAEEQHHTPRHGRSQK